MEMSDSENFFIIHFLFLKIVGKQLKGIVEIKYT